jgi:hypothetical protein
MLRESQSLLLPRTQTSTHNAPKAAGKQSNFDIEEQGPPDARTDETRLERWDKTDYAKRHLTLMFPLDFH